MKYSKNKNNKSGEIVYFLPELMPLVYCSACLDIVLQKNNEAKELYKELVDCFNLPGCQQLFEKVDNVFPEKEKMMKQIVDKSGLDYDKPPKADTAGINVMQPLSEGIIEWTSEQAAIVTPWAIENKRTHQDLTTMVSIVSELVKIGFNKPENMSKNEFKITIANSPVLAHILLNRAMYESRRLFLKRWEKTKVMEFGGRIYNIREILTDDVTARLHRHLTKLYKNSGFVFKHDQTIARIADRWYQCRVVHSGPEEYCRQMQLQGITLDPANISNEIRECDEALGYTRRGQSTNE